MGPLFLYFMIGIVYFSPAILFSIHRFAPETPVTVFLQ